jgi:ABC-type antimicrobial peptide transport system permease subunit
LLLKRVLAWVMTGLGGVALLLAGIGLYGVMSYLVGLRTREIGVRVALGAQRGDILALVLRQGAGQVLMGLVLGFAVAAGTARYLGSMLYGVQPWDPLTYVAVVVILAGAGIVAVLVPVARAMGVNPVEALRSE